MILCQSNLIISQRVPLHFLHIIFADYPNLLMSSFVCPLRGLRFPSWNQTQPLPRRPRAFLTKRFFVRLGVTAAAGYFLERKKRCILVSFFLIDAENNKLI